MNNRVKYALVGGLLGLTATIGTASFVNLNSVGHFKPFLMKDDKALAHQVITHIYSKTGEEKIESFKSKVDQHEIMAFKYPNDDKDNYLAVDVSNLSKSQLNYICSNMNTTDSTELDVLMTYTLNKGYKLDDSFSIAQEYFTSTDSYGMKYIVNEENKEKIKNVAINDFDKLNKLYGGLIAISVGIGSLLMGAAAPSSKKKKEYLKQKEYLKMSK